MKRKRPLLKPLRSSQVPATSAMLYEMEERLNHRMDSGFHKVDSQFAGLRSEMSGLKSEMSNMKSELHRIALLTEEQNARNRYVMDGYAQLYDMLERNFSGR